MQIKTREQMIDDLEKTSRQSTLPFTSIKKEDAELGTQTTKRVTQFDRMMLLVDKYVEGEVILVLRECFSSPARL